jgi:hypothetical protein
MAGRGDWRSITADWLTKWMKSVDDFEDIMLIV